MVSRTDRLRYTLLGCVVVGIVALGYAVVRNEPGVGLLGVAVAAGSGLVLLRGERFVGPMLFGVAAVAAFVAVATVVESGVSPMALLLAALAAVATWRGWGYWRVVNAG